jgi:hypothetical protein
MKRFRPGAIRLTAAAAVMAVAGGIGAAVATTGPASNAMSMGHGVDEFGMTKAFFHGKAIDFTYSKGFFCDTSVSSAATSGCEAGAKWKKAPAKQHDPLYITVPLGFSVKKSRMDCPDGLVCVDHPGTIDLTRLEPALKPLYPQLTDAQLTEALKNAATPGHQHFITDRNHGKREWWDVKVVGVTSKSEYSKITAHRSAAYLKKQIKAGKTTPAIPTNLFLFFSVK